MRSPGGREPMLTSHLRPRLLTSAYSSSPGKSSYVRLQVDIVERGIAARMRKGRKEVHGEVQWANEPT